MKNNIYDDSANIFNIIRITSSKDICGRNKMEFT